MDTKTIDAVIPVYRPGREFPELITRLEKQNRKIRFIYLMHPKDGSDLMHLECIKGHDNIIIEEVEPEEFDHGGTRHRGICRSDADYILCMTQDAVPSDRSLTERLAEALREENVAAAYARQLARKDCRQPERYIRSFNYPEISRVKSQEDLGELGIKTYFCSNVCAMYRSDIYRELGGFERHTIFNEDMIYAAGCIGQGYRIAYAAEAKVIHSHNYSDIQQFKRNFDLAVSQAMHPEIFRTVKSESEGIRMVTSAAAYLLLNGHPLAVVRLFTSSTAKYLGYLLGKNYERLPRKVVLAFTMNPRYWGKS